MMFVLSTFLVIILFGTLDAQQPNVDFNRLQLTSADSRRYNQIYNPSSHVTDGYNSWYMTNPPVYVPNYGAAINTHVPSQIHPSREDPRLFYQSQAYLQDNNRKNVNNEVSFIYPGREVLQATHGNNFGAALAHLRRRGDRKGPCLKCPPNMILNLEHGSNYVKVPALHLTTCSGQRASRDYHFAHLSGPNPGFEIQKGSHLLVGRIMHRGRTLQTCKTHIEVNQLNSLESVCQTPSYLVAHCNGYQNRTCNFTCQNQRYKLIGESTLTCGKGDTWEGNMPICSKGSRYGPCLKCPPNMILNLEHGSKYVKVPALHLTTCSGQRASRDYRFEHLSGPKPGFEIQKGSHLLVGRVMHRGRTLQTCKTHILVKVNQVNTLESVCNTPSYLVAHCYGYQNKTCNFTCQNKRYKLIGEPTLTCGKGDTWEGNVPICSKGKGRRIRRWCSTIPPPTYGRLSCRGKTFRGKNMVEGSKCTVTCVRGRYRWTPPVTAVCRRGSWDRKLTCQYGKQ